MPDEEDKEDREVIASQDLASSEPLKRVASPSQTHLSVSGAASLASASSVPPPLLSRPSLKATATASHSSSQSNNSKSPPSLLIHSADSTQRVILSPSPSRPSFISNSTDDGIAELSLSETNESHRHLEGTDLLGSPAKDDPSIKSQFLTQRLRSAIGEDLVLRESQGISSVGQVDSIATSSVANVTNSITVPIAETSSQLNGPDDGSVNDQGWGWKTLGNLPSSLRFDGASKAVKRSNDTAPEDPSSGAVIPAEESKESLKEEKTDAFSLGSYMKPLDVRKWWAPLSDSSASSSKDRPLVKSRSNSQHDSIDASTSSTGGKPREARAKSKASTEPASPLRGLPAGSFPSPSVAKRSKKKREQVPKEAKSIEQANFASKEAATAKEGPHIKEHNLENRTFGIQSKDGDAFPQREYFVLSTAGKPIFVSYISKARLKRAAETKSRGQARQLQACADESAESDEELLAAKELFLQDEEDQKAATSVGVLQALISNYESQGMEELQRKSIEILELPKGTRICYFLRPPLYLAATSLWGEDESTLTNHLEYLYLSILSLVSASKLTRLFDRAANFDLKRLLDGTDAILDKLLSDLQAEASPLYDSLHPLRLDATLRASASAALVPPREKIRPQDALYALLVTQHGIITLAKRKKKGIHPIDCHLLINTVFATKAMKESGTQTWVPICLPKFAPQGYLYAHVSFLNNEEVSQVSRDDGNHNVNHSRQEKERTNLALVLMTSNPDGFEEMSAWRDNIIETLHYQRLRPKLNVAVQQDKAQYSISELQLPGLRHFIFKWRSNLQSTSPIFEDPYEDGSNDQRRLICLYGIAQECIYRRADVASKVSSNGTSSQSPSVHYDKSDDTPSSPIIKPKSVLADTKPSPTTTIPSNAGSNTTSSVPPPAPSSALALKRKATITGQHLLKTSHEIIFAWSTPSFELYLAVGSHLPRNAIINIAKSILKWIKQEESRLFIANPSIFD